MSNQQYIEAVTGFPLDSFQKKALDVIEKGDDLLTTLPTGSGKTVIALTAIIVNAFLKGHRAILTTPVKALSNQKYSEFREWLSKAGHPNRVSLLTGDIQSRATPSGGDGLPELIIMTSEILANKLEKENVDPDLVNVSVLVIDEAHYINDPDRGHVWERTIMNLPPSIQITALSATLSEPDQFRGWLCKRRATQLVQRMDRHVPLHFGFYDAKGAFIELYNTRKEDKVMLSETYTKLKPQMGTLAQSMNRLVTNLSREQKLPAIVFLMSKNKCEEAARTITANLLYGPRPVMGKDDDPLAFGEIVSEHTYQVKTIRNRQDELYQRYLRPFHPILSKLPGFEEWKSMVDRGVAYHHAGLIPILREFTEILFSVRLISLVFATETLAIGINMPTRCVVFTELEKPSGNSGNDIANTVMLRPEQFMQMAGRSGRRGIDEKGYVVYYPVKKVVTESEFKHLLFGKMPVATSQLSITPLFVLKSIMNRKENLDRSLLQYQKNGHIRLLEERLVAFDEFPNNTNLLEKGAKLTDLEEQLKPGLFKMSQSVRKGIEKELNIVKNELGAENVVKLKEYFKLRQELDWTRDSIQADWDQTKKWLTKYQFLEESGNLTIVGKVVGGLSDGCPITRGVMIGRGKLDALSFHEIVGWLGYFTEYAKATGIDEIVESLDKINECLDETHNTLYTLDMEELDGKISYEMSVLVYLWSINRDIAQICYHIGFGNLGTFIRGVMRVISFIDEMKEHLLGLGFYELYNRLDNHQAKLLDGIVTNQSLYMM
jgi:superfamily II RNA helicase